MHELGVLFFQEPQQGHLTFLLFAGFSVFFFLLWVAFHCCLVFSPQSIFFFFGHQLLEHSFCILCGFFFTSLFSISLAGSSDPISPGFVCSAFCQWIFSIHPQAFCKMFWPLLQPFCKAWLSLQLLSLFARAGLSLLSP